MTVAMAGVGGGVTGHVGLDVAETLRPQSCAPVVREMPDPGYGGVLSSAAMPRGPRVPTPDRASPPPCHTFSCLVHILPSVPCSPDPLISTFSPSTLSCLNPSKIRS